MADTHTLSTVQRVAVKQVDGTLGEESHIGTTSDYVVHKRIVGGQEKYYSTDKIIDNYLDFIETVPFIYQGTDLSAPTNTERIAIWIDRSSTNQDDLEID